MSEGYDEKCATSEKTNKDNTNTCTEVPEDDEPSAKADAIDIHEENNDAEKDILSWTEENSQFCVSWRLPEGTATTKDYVALWLKGQFYIYLLFY